MWMVSPAAKSKLSPQTCTRLVQGAHQVHLHPPEVRVVEGPMAPGAQVEVRPQLAIDALQQVEVEGGGDPGGIVIGRIQHGRCLFQIHTDQEQAAGADQLGHHGQEVGGPVRVEVADAGAGEEGHPRPLGGAVRHRHLAGEIGAGGMDLQPGELGGHLLGRHPQVLAGDVHGHIGAGPAGPPAAGGPSCNCRCRAPPGRCRCPPGPRCRRRGPGGSRSRCGSGNTPRSG